MCIKKILNASVLGLVIALNAGAALAEQFVWKVPGNNGNSVYLVGSVHLLPPRAYPLPPAFEQAYKNSEILMFETDISALENPATQFKLLRQASYPTGETLSQSLPPPLLASLRAATAATSLPMAMLDRFKPWFAATLIELTAFTKAGFRPDLGVDMYFQNRAQSDGKATVGLETLDAHLAVLTDMPESLSEAYLSDTLDNLQLLETAPTELFDYWQTGDAESLATYVEEQAQTNPALYARLVDERNHAWLADIEALLNGNANAMVVVGALHLAGEQGLPTLLKARGYQPVQQ